MAMTEIETLQAQVTAEIERAASLDALEQIRIAALGKKGAVTGLMKKLPELAIDQRKAYGAQVNALKQALEATLAARQLVLGQSALQAKLIQDRIDITLPSVPQPVGSVHPISQTIDEIVAIFGEMGFSWAEGPDIEDDWHNFTALNIPPEHPARQMHDTFYLPPRADGTPVLLRTHTSPVQVRTMMQAKPPIRIIVPGRTFRIDSDATHTPMFHQVEGLAIDEHSTMAHLKGCLTDFVRAYFEMQDVPTRFRPSYFPFTEPSAEFDIGCSWKDGELRIGAGDSWLEILGCGMVHPRVLEYCGIDSTKYQGFAFGMGIERIAMLKYGIPDLRTFFDSDLRWLRHYGFSALDIPSLTGGLSR